jgi:hypothetical protein
MTSSDHKFGISMNNTVFFIPNFRNILWVYVAFYCIKKHLLLVSGKLKLSLQAA